MDLRCDQTGFAGASGIRRDTWRSWAYDRIAVGMARGLDALGGHAQLANCAKCRYELCCGCCRTVYDGDGRTVVLRAVVLATVAATFRYAAQWGGTTPDEFYEAAAEVEAYLAGDDCPVCQEVTCDDHCPLARVRSAEF